MQLITLGFGLWGRGGLTGDAAAAEGAGEGWWGAGAVAETAGER